MSEPAVLTERRDGVLVITLNRPEALNAFPMHMVRQFEVAVREAVADPGVVDASTSPRS